MKPADLKPGTVYGYKPGKYDPLRPVLVVDNTYWRRTSRSFGSAEEFEFYSLDEFDAARRARDEENGRSPSRPLPRGYGGGDSSPDCGLLAIDFRTSRGGMNGRDEDQRLADGETLTEFGRDKAALARALRTIRGLKAGRRELRNPPGSRAHLLNPAWIVGEWAEMYQAERDEQQRRRNLEAEAKAESDVRVANAMKRVEALRALGLPGEIADAAEHNRHNYSGEWTPPRYSGNTDRVTLSMRQVDALLSLIPDGAQWREEDVEEDGWTLRKPEYDDEDDDEGDADDAP